MALPKPSQLVTQVIRHRPSLKPIITQLSYELHALHPLPEGGPHPQFPRLMLQYHLLTEAQLDCLAKYYHQWTRSPTLWTYGYPECMNWNHEFLEHVGALWGADARIRIKRRKFGRFIGLRECNTPDEELDELERWTRQREAIIEKSMGDFWAGRRGFGRW